MNKYQWKDFYPAKFRRICKNIGGDTYWVFEKRKFIFFWREYSICKTYQTSEVLMSYYRDKYEKRGKL